MTYKETLELIIRKRISHMNDILYREAENISIEDIKKLQEEYRGLKMALAKY